MKVSFSQLLGLGVVLGLAGCNTPAARSPEAARSTPPAPRAAPAPASPVSSVSPTRPTAPTVQAVRYQLLTETDSKPACQEANGNSQSLTVTRQFLHLLGPDTLRPALRELQCPPPAQRRAQLREALKELHCESAEGEAQYGAYSGTEVLFNAHGLLCLLVTEATDTGGPYPQTDNQLCTYDLATGKPCAVEKWLRPGQEPALRRLLTQHLLADSTARDFLAAGTAGQESALAQPYLVEQLPPLGINTTGLFFLLGELGVPHVAERVAITIPYAALCSYVLPGTPLARVLAAQRP